MFTLFRRSSLFTFLLAILSLVWSPAAVGQLHDSPVNISSILPSPFITDIDQDASGFIWISTYEGLCKFDGTRVHTFNQPEDAGGFPSLMTTETAYDSSQNLLWVGTANGLAKIDPESHVITAVAFPDTVQLRSRNIAAMDFASDGTLWFGIELFGLGHIMSDGELELFPLPSVEIDQGPDGYGGIMDVVCDPNDPDIIWAGASGLIKFNRQSREYQFAKIDHPDRQTRLYFNQIRSLYPAKDGSIYAGTWSRGLLRLNPDSMTRTRNTLYHSSYEILSHDGVNPPLYPDGDGFWVSSTPEGTRHYSLRDRRFGKSYRVSTSAGRTYPFIVELKDNRQRYWASSEYGVYMFDPLNNQVENYSFEPGPEEYFYVDGVLLELEDEHLILCTYERCKGVYAFDRTSSEFTLCSSPEFLSLGGPPFNGEAILKMPDDRLIVVERGGLFEVDLTQNTLKRFTSPLDDLEYLWTSAILSSENELWLGTSRSGLVRYDLETQVVSHYKNELLSSTQSAMTSIGLLFEDSRRNIWIKRQRGFSVYRHGSGTFENVDSINGKDFEARSFAQGSSGQVWIAVPGMGIASVDAESPSRLRQVLDRKDGISDLNVRSINLDNLGQLWAITGSGVISYDTTSHVIRSFSDADGFVTFDPAFNRNPMNLSHLQMGADETMWYAPRGGLSAFRPQDMIVNDEVPRVYTFGIETRDTTYMDLEKTRWNFTSHDLPVTLHFSALAFSQSDKIQYEYALGNDGGRWVALPGNSLVFNTLDPGTYAIRYRCRGSHGKYSEPGSIILRLRPPWWQSWWFYLALIVAAISTWFLLSRWKNNQRRILREKELEIATLATSLESRALRSQMNPHFLFNIFNTIQELILTEDTVRAYEYTSKFSKLLRMILDYSAKEEISIEDEAIFLDLYLQLESLRFDRAFSYSIQIEDGLEHIKIPVFLIQPLVENAVRHGLLPQNGEKVLIVKFNANDTEVECEVSDNGVGFNHINSENPNSERVHAIELIEKRVHLLKQGSLTIQSANGDGTKALLSIPY